jgi:3-oxoacyl-[acyl-carrier protein] reductase
MDLGLKDKVAIVTGSARGLGAAMARRLAARGRQGRRDGHPAEAGGGDRRRCAPRGIQVHCVVGDITKAADVQRLVDETVAHFRRRAHPGEQRRACRATSTW